MSIENFRITKTNRTTKFKFKLITNVAHSKYSSTIAFINKRFKLIVPFVGIHVSFTYGRHTEPTTVCIGCGQRTCRTDSKTHKECLKSEYEKDAWLSKMYIKYNNR